MSFDAAYDAALARWPVPVTAIDVETPFGSTRVNRCGPADGVPLVLLPGGRATSTVWFANVADLSRRRPVHALDLAGDAGRTVLSRPIQAIDDQLEWLGASLPDPVVDLCGHSYGAWLALSFALRYPARVRRLVLLDPTGCFAGFRPWALLHAAPGMLRPSPARARAYLRWETRGAALDPTWLEVTTQAATIPLRVATGGRPRGIEGCSTPTLVVLAGQSRLHDVARVGAGARRLPHVESTTLPGVSHHMMPMHQADRLNALVDTFLTVPRGVGGVHRGQAVESDGGRHGQRDGLTDRG